jgi:hypothetical protein
MTAPACRPARRSAERVRSSIHPSGHRRRRLGELHAAGLAAVDVDDQDMTAGRWSAVPAPSDPLLEAVDLHGAHDFRHTYATWLRTPASRRGSSTS